METTFTIQQAQGMVGMVIPRLIGKVTAVYDRKTGEGQYGPWSLQGATITDSTGSMKVTFKQLPSQEKLVGKTMVFKSMEGKHGLKGVEVKKNEYNGKETIELHVSKAALVVTSDDESSVTVVQDSPRSVQAVVASGKGNVTSGSEPYQVSHQDIKDGMAMAKNRLTQLAGLYDLCWKTVGSMDSFEGVRSQGDNALKDVASCLFIQATREGLADRMPVRTLSKFYNEEVIKPASAKYPGSPLEDDPKEGLEDDNIPF